MTQQKQNEEQMDTLKRRLKQMAVGLFENLLA